ncbi:MAG: ATP-binding protein [Oscillospiraceae bacterium]|nr:ATP-binding protein [Oscillospiraceae bacterium]
MTGKILRISYLVAISALLASALLFFGVMYRDYEDGAFARLRAEAAAIAQGLGAVGSDYFDSFAPDDRVTWIAANGTVLYDSAAPAQLLESHAGREEIDQALQTGEAQTSRYSKTLLQRTFYYAKLLEGGTVLRVSCTQNSLPAMILMLLTPFLWVATLVLILCGVLSYRLARQITKPLNAINPDNPAPLPSYPELTPLFDKLREQNRTIGKQMNELQLRQREFTAITENMREGFLLVDCKMHVLSSNHSALEVLGGRELKPGCLLYDAECSQEIFDAVDTALSGSHAELLLTIDETSWQVLANPVVASGQVAGAVVLFMDVTEREQRELLRREFSANVSHELKTPLTSISGFAELMKEGLVPPEKIPEFSGDIYKESLRLIGLVNDIIQLSRLDENSTQFQRAPVDLYDLCAQSIERLSPVAARQSVTLALTGEHAEIMGVEQLLKEMIYNLLDNAIKYNVPGGSVTASVRKSAGRTILSVSDTGIGIPYAHQPRVFERFYRVDKSHSKEVGGTGLGLSIVRHAAQYHGARLELKSQPGKGTTITVTF